MAEYQITRADGHWVTDPVEHDRLNQPYWAEVAGRVVVDETTANRKRILRVWAVQDAEDQYSVQWLCTILGKHPWVYGGKSSEPFTTLDQARHGVARLARSL